MNNFLHSPTHELTVDYRYPSTKADSSAPYCEAYQDYIAWLFVYAVECKFSEWCKGEEYTKKIVSKQCLQFSEFDPADELLIGRKVTLVLHLPNINDSEDSPLWPEVHVGRIINRR